MAEDNKLEDIVKEQEEPDKAAEAPAEKKSGSIDDIVNRGGTEKDGTKMSGFLDTLKSFTAKDWLSIAAATGLGTVAGGSTAALGLLNTATTIGSYVTAKYLTNRKKGFDKEDLKSDFTLGAAMTPVLFNVYKMLSSVSNPVGKVLAGLYGAIPVVNSSYLALKYLNKKYGYFGMMKKYLRPIKLVKEIYNNAIKPDYARTAKNVYKYLSLPLSLVWTLPPLDYQLPITALTRTAYATGMNMAMGKKETKPGDAYRLPQDSYNKDGGEGGYGRAA
jgi:hypothetical protein